MQDIADWVPTTAVKMSVFQDVILKLNAILASVPSGQPAQSVHSTSAALNSYDQSTKGLLIGKHS